MRRLTKDHLFRNQGTPQLPEPFRVQLGEVFEIETTDTGNRNIRSAADIDKPNGPLAGNPWTGPVYAEGVKAGEVIAVTIEQIEVTDHCFLPLGEGTLLPPELVKPRQDLVLVEGDVAVMPGGVRVPVRPMFGCFGVVPAEKVFADPWDHGGNMDIPDVCAGNTIHVRCQRDGGYFACGDGHALQGEGEINGFSLEVSLLGRIRIERSPYQQLEAMLIETPEKFITVGIAHEVPESIRKAVYAMSRFAAQVRGMDLLDAYQLVSHVGDVRLGAVWPMWCTKWHIPIPVCLHVSRSLLER